MIAIKEAYAVLGNPARRAEFDKARIQEIVTLILEQVDSFDGFQFEQYVAGLLRQQGFTVELTKASGDFGVDIIAEKTPSKYATQVKRQTSPVSRHAVSDAVAGMRHYGCNSAMVITNNYFSPGAIELAKSTECELVDRATLTKWMIASKIAAPGVPPLPSKPLKDESSKRPSLLGFRLGADKGRATLWDDPLTEEAIKIIRKFNQVSASMLQRKLGIGYPRAAHLLDHLEAMGIIGPDEGNGKPRAIF